MARRHFLMLFVALAVGGCTASRASQESAVKQRAAFDLQCDATDIRIVELNEAVGEPTDTGVVTRGVFGAEGCGTRASYVVECRQGTCQAIMNSDQKKSEQSRISEEPSERP
jgi:hypothetical protein